VQKELLWQLEGEDSLDLHRAYSHASGLVCVLISHPHDTALRGRLPSENRFEHGPWTPQMPFDNAAASVNGDFFAFGFSRPRYAAFRIKLRFTWVLCYWDPCLIESAIHTSLRTRIPYWLTGTPPGCRRRCKGRQ